MESAQIHTKKAICSFGAPPFCRYNCINTQHRAGAVMQRIRLTYGVRLPIKIIFGLGGLVFDRVICRFGTQNRRVLKLQITKRKRHKRWLKIQTKSTLRSQKKRQQSETAIIATHFLKITQCDTFHRKRKTLGNGHMASCLKPMESKKI